MQRTSEASLYYSGFGRFWYEDRQIFVQAAWLTSGVCGKFSDLSHTCAVMPQQLDELQAGLGDDFVARLEIAVRDASSKRNIGTCKFPIPLAAQGIETIALSATTP